MHRTLAAMPLADVNLTEPEKIINAFIKNGVICEGTLKPEDFCQKLTFANFITLSYINDMKLVKSNILDDNVFEKVKAEYAMVHETIDEACIKIICKLRREKFMELDIHTLFAALWAFSHYEKTGYEDFAHMYHLIRGFVPEIGEMTVGELLDLGCQYYAGAEKEKGDKIFYGMLIAPLKVVDMNAYQRILETLYGAENETIQPIIQNYYKCMIVCSG